MAHDPFDAYRRSALDGLSPAAPAAPWRKAPRARDTSGAPVLPPGLERLTREPLVGILREEAGRCWRRAVPAWSPSLEAVLGRGPLAVEVHPGLVTVSLAHATCRARGIPTPWVGVVVALLTGIELGTVRKALRRGVRRFEPGGRT